MDRKPKRKPSIEINLQKNDDDYDFPYDNPEEQVQEEKIIKKQKINEKQEKNIYQQEAPPYLNQPKFQFKQENRYIIQDKPVFEEQKIDEEAPQNQKKSPKKLKIIQKPVGVFKYEKKVLNHDLINKYGQQLKDVILNKEITTLLNKYQQIPDSITDPEFSKRFAAVFDYQDNVQNSQNLAISIQDFNGQISNRVKQSYQIDNFSFYEGAFNLYQALGEMFPNRQADPQNDYRYLFCNNFPQKSELFIVDFLARLIRTSQTYQNMIQDTTPVDEDFFKTMMQSDSIKQITNNKYLQGYRLILDYQDQFLNNPNIPEEQAVQYLQNYEFWLSYLINFSQLPASFLYQEYLTIQLPQTEPQKIINNPNQSFINQAISLKYIAHKKSLERLGGRISASKNGALIVLLQLREIQHWIQGTYINEFNDVQKSDMGLSIVQRIFLPQPYQDVTGQIVKNQRDQNFFSLPVYFSFLIAHRLNVINLQNEEYSGLQTLIPYKNQVFQFNPPHPQQGQLDRLFINKTVEEGVRQFDQVIQIGFYQALDISNIKQYNPQRLGDQIEDTEEVGNNPLSIKGLILGLKNNIQYEPIAMHYITFIFRVPLQFLLQANDEDQKQRIGNYFYGTFADDIEDATDEPDSTHYLYKQGKILIDSDTATKLAEGDDEQIVYEVTDKIGTQLYNLILEILEEYGSEDSGFDLAGTQIIEYQIFSLPLHTFEYTGEPFEMMKVIPKIMPENKYFVKDKKFYKPLDDYFDFEEINCVTQVFAYIYFKVKGLDYEISNQNIKNHYFTSDFYIKYKKFLELQELVISYKIFIANLEPKIQLYFIQSKALFYNDREPPLYCIKYAFSHCWLDKQGINQYVDYENYSRFTYCLNQNIALKKKKDQVDNNRIEFYYDIETMSVPIQKVRKTNKKKVDGFNQIPILLCYEIVDQFGTITPGYFFGENCCQEFCFLLSDYYLIAAADEDKSEEKIYVYAHNGNNFDHLFLFPILVKLFGQGVSFGGSSLKLKFLKIGTIMTFIDTCELIPGKLKDLACDFKVADRKLDFDVKKITKENLEDPDFKQKLIKYCQIDVTVMRQIVVEFYNTLKKVIPQLTRDDIKMTLPSTALNIFRKYFIPANSEQIYGNMCSSQGFQVQNYERTSYYGGLCQVWNYNQVEKGSLYYDFVSMYVSVLSEEVFPLSAGTVQIKKMIVNLQQINQIVSHNLYIVDAFSFNDDAKLPNLPIRDPGKKSSIYALHYKADGNIPYLAFWGKEILLAFQKLKLKFISVTKTVIYNKVGNVFKAYMTTFFDIKKAHAEGPLRAIAKLFGNSLYGKWGQQPFGFKLIITQQEVKAVGYFKINETFQGRQQLIMQLQKMNPVSPIAFIKELDKEYVEVEFEPNQIETNFCGSLIRLASYVTMCGRCWLFTVLYHIGYENLYYCDTDSCVFKKEGLAGLKQIRNIGKERGDIAPQFSDDYEIIGGEFIAPKCYYLQLNKPYKNKEFYIKCKGIIAPTLEKMQQLSKEGKTEIKQEKWEKKYGGVEILQDIKRLIKQQFHFNL